jgi:alkylation response protein AidB-like acyl-CoA dehydrogenase
MTDASALVEERIDKLLAELDPASTDPVEFRGRQYDLGLAWVHFPEGSGGLGVPPALQRRVDERVFAAGAAPPASREFFGWTLAAPTVVTNGDEALRERLLRRMFTGEDAWCQLFSEPGAGSDLAGLATRAVRDGDESRTGACSWPGPTRMCPSTRASPTSPWTCTRPASRSGRCGS